MPTAYAVIKALAALSLVAALASLAAALVGMVMSRTERESGLLWDEKEG